MTQCYKCQGYGHIAVLCRKPQTCANCTNEQNSGSCPTPDDSSKHFCCNCNYKHYTCDRACPVRKAKAKQAAVAYNTRPTSYKTAGKSVSSPNPVHLVLLFPPTPAICCKQGPACTPYENSTQTSTPIHDSGGWGTCRMWLHNCPRAGR
jgi:hypothetical protein